MMRVYAEISAVDTVSANKAGPCRFWVAGLLFASLASWALVVCAARLIATLA